VPATPASTRFPQRRQAAMLGQLRVTNVEPTVVVDLQ